MLRNVLTYMGLGPDEDYEEGYLRETDDEIDLTDEPAEQTRPAQRSTAQHDPAQYDPAQHGPAQHGPAQHGTGQHGPGQRRPSGRTDRFRSDDGYPEDVDERDADEPADDREPRVDGAFERPREGRRVNRAGRAERANGAAPSDPHAQRERPGWLAAPTPSGDRSRVTTRTTVPAVEDSDATQRGIGRSRRGAHDADGAGRVSREIIDDIDRLDDVDDVVEVEDPRPLRAVPPREPESLSPNAATTETMTREPEIRLVPPRILAPRSFGDAKELADEFKAIVPVVMDLQGVDRELARRLIDFASGICYAMDGSMEKIASQVFLLIPVGVEVSADERRRLEARRPTDRS